MAIEISLFVLDFQLTVFSKKASIKSYSVFRFLYMLYNTAAICTILCMCVLTIPFRTRKAGTQILTILSIYMHKKLVK